MTATEARLRNIAKGWEVHAANAAARREEYAWLRERQGHDVVDAADRLGVSLRTAERYERWRKSRKP